MNFSNKYRLSKYKVIFSSPDENGHQCQLLPSLGIHRLSSIHLLTFHILIISSETTEANWTNLGRNDVGPSQKLLISFWSAKKHGRPPDVVSDGQFSNVCQKTLSPEAILCFGQFSNFFFEATNANILIIHRNTDWYTIYNYSSFHTAMILFRWYDCHVLTFQQNFRTN